MNAPPALTKKPLQQRITEVKERQAGFPTVFGGDAVSIIEELEDIIAWQDRMLKYNRSEE